MQTLPPHGSITSQATTTNPQLTPRGRPARKSQPGAQPSPQQRAHLLCKQGEGGTWVFPSLPSLLPHADAPRVPGSSPGDAHGCLELGY